MGRRTVGGGRSRGDVCCSLAARWMDAPGAFIVLSLGRHDPRCANSNQRANYEPSRPGPALWRWLLRLMMAGRPQQFAPPDPRSHRHARGRGGKKKKHNLECHITQESTDKKNNNERTVYAALHSPATSLGTRQVHLLVDVKLLISQSHGSNATDLCLSGRQ